MRAPAEHGALRGDKIDRPRGAGDDLCNAACGALVLATARADRPRVACRPQASMPSAPASPERCSVVCARLRATVGDDE